MLGFRLVAGKRDEVELCGLENIVVRDVHGGLSVGDHDEIVPGLEFDQPVDRQDRLGLSGAVESFVVVHVAVRVFLDGVSFVRAGN